MFVGFIMLKLGLEHLQRITIYRWILGVILCGLIASSAENVLPEVTLVYAFFSTSIRALLRYPCHFCFFSLGYWYLD